jgi:uncharacterized membrane protein
MVVQSIAISLHVASAVVWVGGMFLIYICLRPALGTLEPPQRLRLMRATLAKFLPFVWGAIVLILITGYWMVFVTFGGFGGVGFYIHWMQLFGWAMVGLFMWLFHGPWLAFRRAVDAQDWPNAAVNLDQIRQIIAVNMPLGFVVIIIGVSGRYWGF